MSAFLITTLVHPAEKRQRDDAPWKQNTFPPVHRDLVRASPLALEQPCLGKGEQEQAGDDTQREHDTQQAQEPQRHGAPCAPLSANATLLGELPRQRRMPNMFAVVPNGMEKPAHASEPPPQPIVRRRPLTRQRVRR